VKALTFSASTTPPGVSFFATIANVNAYIFKSTHTAPKWLYEAISHCSLLTARCSKIALLSGFCCAKTNRVIFHDPDDT
jgi:hypothetical protein